MRFPLIFSLSVMLVLAGGLSAATIGFSVSPLGQSGGSGASGLNSYRLTYSVQDVVFLANQELDIRFDPALYVSLTNGKAPNGFDLLLEQPNNPSGTFGDYSAMALLNNASLSGTFSVDVLSYARPSGQNFYINQLDAFGNIQSIITSGVTISADVPEPSTGVALLVGSLLLAVRYRFRRV